MTAYRVGVADMSKKLGDLLDKAPVKPAEEPWSSVPDGGIIWVRRTAEHELSELYALTQREVAGDLAPFEVLSRMHAQNADSLWSVYRASDATRADTTLIGYYALIHLNQAGREMLEAGAFDGHDPDMRTVVASATRPAAIYVWVAIVRRVARVATWLLANALGAEVYGGVPIFATAGTMGGLNSIKGYGFSTAQAEAGLGKLYRLDRGETPTVAKPATARAAS
jgi:hypothetical protein